jgi:hypothetical protein
MVMLPSLETIFVVKYGRYIRENEGYVLLLEEKYPLIPAPWLYAMHRKDDIIYLVIQLILGTDLLKLWDGLPCNQKVSM